VPATRSHEDLLAESQVAVGLLQIEDPAGDGLIAGQDSSNGQLVPQIADRVELHTPDRPHRHDRVRDGVARDFRPVRGGIQALHASNLPGMVGLDALDGPIQSVPDGDRMSSAVVFAAGLSHLARKGPGGRPTLCVQDNEEVGAVQVLDGAIELLAGDIANRRAGPACSRRRGLGNVGRPEYQDHSRLQFGERGQCLVEDGCRAGRKRQHRPMLTVAAHGWCRAVDDKGNEAHG
jgi:hypothetical protein